jgi:hypothetical protein
MRIYGRHGDVEEGSPSRSCVGRWLVVRMPLYQLQAHSCAVLHPSVSWIGKTELPRCVISKPSTTISFPFIPCSRLFYGPPPIRTMEWRVSSEQGRCFEGCRRTCIMATHTHGGVMPSTTMSERMSGMGTFYPTRRGLLSALIPDVRDADNVPAK